MRWGDMRRSDNVEERGADGGGGGGFGIGGVPLGGGALLLIVVVSLLFGVNPLEILGVMSGGDSTVQQQTAPTPGAPTRAPTGAPSTKAGDFAARVLGDTEDFWGQTFKAAGSKYTPPRLVMFNGRTQSACGVARTASGPFYCPGDREVYLDTAFFDELRTRFGAPGDFAAAYVIAHEVGHHVQNSLGTMQKFDAEASRLDTRGRNALSVRLELQADCFAGVWGASARKRGLLDAGDADEAIRAAGSVGDDRIQKQTQGVVVPDAFTHGTAEQRIRWFRTGFDSGDPATCDTFASRQ